MQEGIVSFLLAARLNCINSILLSDFISKIELLKQREEFSDLLNGFNSETIISAIETLNQAGIVSSFINGQDIEVMLSYAASQEWIRQSSLTEKEKMIYLRIANMYRTLGMEIDLNKKAKTKGND